jgi:hypothetical protein
VGFRAADFHDALEVNMTTIRKEIRIDAPVDRVWDALRDVGALHTKLVPGFVKDTRMEGNTRVVTFGNDMVAREDIVSIDPAQHRRRLGGGRSTVSALQRRGLGGIRSQRRSRFY